jgi:hypothetical protein
MKVIVYACIFFVFIGKSTLAQPGDNPYSLVIYDPNNWGFIDCNVHLNTYQVFGCEIDYLSSDFLQTSWTPNFKTLKVIDTLTCSENTNTLFPFKTFYIGKSYLNTRMLLVIKNSIDTMFIDGAGENLMSDYYGTQNNLMAVIPFNKGLTKLFELQKETQYRRIQNMTYRSFWMSSNSNIPVYNPWVKRISSIVLNKEKFYQISDTLIIEVTGHVTSDGSCADGAVLWILQKKEGNNWLSVKERMTQMDCGRGQNTFDHKRLPLFIITKKINPNLFSFPMQIELDPGTYRLIIFDDLGLPYFSETFHM